MLSAISSDSMSTRPASNAISTHAAARPRTKVTRLSGVMRSGPSATRFAPGAVGISIAGVTTTATADGSRPGTLPATSFCTSRSPMGVGRPARALSKTAA